MNLTRKQLKTISEKTGYQFFAKTNFANGITTYEFVKYKETITDKVLYKMFEMSFDEKGKLTFDFRERTLKSFPLTKKLKVNKSLKKLVRSIIF